MMRARFELLQYYNALYENVPFFFGPEDLASLEGNFQAGVKIEQKICMAPSKILLCIPMASNNLT